MSLKSIASFDSVPISEEVVSGERWYLYHDPHLEMLGMKRYNRYSVQVTTDKKLAWNRKGYVYYVSSGSVIKSYTGDRVAEHSELHPERVV